VWEFVVYTEMPKKLHTNPKAEEARQRKDTVKKEKKANELKQSEDARWADEGRSASELRALEREKKKEEEQRKKQLKKEALLKEEAEKKSVKTIKTNPHKVTLAEIQATTAAKKAEKAKQQAEEEARKKARIILPEAEIAPNINQLEKQRIEEDRQRFGENGVIDARSLTEAVNALSITDSRGSEEDRHPEKRLKAAYREYEKIRWDQLKQENPTLKFSQIKDLLFKQWQKAPENPLNQAAMRESYRGISSSTISDDEEEEGKS